MKQRGLTPDIFAAKGELSRETYVIKRLRQTHDLWHVLTGIDLDVPGELELQAFTLLQMRVPSTLVHPTLPARAGRPGVALEHPARRAASGAARLSFRACSR